MEGGGGISGRRAPAHMHTGKYPRCLAHFAVITNFSVIENEQLTFNYLITQETATEYVEEMQSLKIASTIASIGSFVRSPFLQLFTLL